jgi:hypothetical protein
MQQDYSENSHVLSSGFLYEDSVTYRPYLEI